MDDNKRRELLEAINAGNIAIDRLQEAKQHLSSASNWGILDIFGGGFLTSMIKHGKLDDAQNAINAATNAINSFRTEVSDVNSAMGMNIGVGELATCFDLFCDSMIADIYVQSKISDARKQVDRTLNEINEIIRTLKITLSNDGESPKDGKGLPE